MVAATGSGTGSLSGSKKNSTSAASSVGGKGGTSGSSSTGGARSGAGGAGGVRGGGKSESAGSKATSAAAGAASSVGSKSSAASPVGARSANAATGPNNYGGGRNSDTTTAMGQRGLLGGGGSILSNPSVVSRSVGGLLSGADKQGAQYGNGTFNTGYSGPKGVALDKTLNNQALVAAAGPYGHYTDPRQQAMQRLVARGWTPAQAQGIIGNLAFESGMNPLAAGDFGPRYGGLPGVPTARGLAQWRGDRLAALEGDTSPFTATKGPSLEAQVDFADRELKGLASNVDRGAIRVGNQFAANPGMTRAQAATAFARGFERPSSQAFGSSIGTRIAGGNVNLDGGYSAPSLSNAVRTASAPTVGRAEKIGSLVAAAPKMQDRIAAEPNLNGLGFQQAAYNDRGTPSPMSGQGILGPSGLANMADLGMRQAVSPVNQNQTMAQMGNPIGGMSFNPGLPGQMPGPDRSRSPGIDGAPMAASDPRSMGPDMARTDTPTSAWNGDVLGPINPQPSPPALSAGMSFNPGLPRNPIGGMAFNPPMPRNPIGGMAFNPGLPRNPISGMAFNPATPGMMPGPERSRSPGIEEAPQVAQGIPNQPGLEGPDPLSAALGQIGQSIGKGFTATGSALKQYNDNKGKLAIAKAFGYNPIGDAVKAYASQGIRNMQAALDPSNYSQPSQTQVAQNTPAPSPGQPSQPASQPSYGGQQVASNDGGNNGGMVQLPTQWTGRESESQVAAMAKNVEEVLRGYFVQIPGQQYPQYTTGPA